MRGGTNFSIRSLKMMSPTLSLFVIAENASTAQISTATSPFIRDCEPNSPEALTSTTSMRVSSRSSSNTLTNGVPVRAVTFQSMLRMSSPY